MISLLKWWLKIGWESFISMSKYEYQAVQGSEDMVRVSVTNHHSWYNPTTGEMRYDRTTSHHWYRERLPHEKVQA